MKLNLETLHGEIRDHLESQGLVVFHSYPRSDELPSAVYWDVGRHPDFRQFVASAQAAGVQMMALYAREFTPGLIDEALDRLAHAELDRDERRAIDLRLREARGYEGFTCQIELSFDHAGRTYVFDLRTEWFDDLTDLLERIEDAHSEEPDDRPLGGDYFSKN
jgi:hypothetical protein